MEQLNIDRINTKAPYKVWRTVRDNQFNFITENGVLYGVGFTEEMEIAGIRAYQFSFARLNSDHSGFDEKIKETLVNIIGEFFLANNEIMIYICDTSDKREECRSKLFVRWFKEYDNNDRFVIRTASAEIEGQGFYTAMIVEKRNPRLKDILGDFDATAAVLCDK